MRDEGRRSCSSPTTWARCSRFCHRAMLLERGEVVAIGDPDDVGSRYLELNFGRDAERRRRRAEEPRPPRRRHARGSPTRGSRTSTASASTTLPAGRATTRSDPRRVPRATSRTRRSTWSSADDERAPIVFAASTAWRHERTGAFARRRRGDASRRVRQRLRARPLLAVADRGPPRRRRTTCIDRRERGRARSSSTGPRATGGLVDVPHDRSRCERAAARRSGSRERAPSSRSARRAARRQRDRSARRRWPAASAASLTLAWTLAVLEFRLKFFGSVLGYFWQLVRPLMLFGVSTSSSRSSSTSATGCQYYPARAAHGHRALHVLRRGDGQRRCPPSLDRENLVRKIHFPRMVIPLPSCSPRS